MGVAAAAIGAVGAVASAGSSLIGSKMSADAAKSAGNRQSAQFDLTRSDLLPYNTTGQTANANALTLAQSGPTGGGPNYLDIAANGLTEQGLRQTPGYQFDLSQGLKATQSAAAARGLGVSGAALKGAATYATGLADKTYQNQFQDYLNLNTGQQGNLTNQFNRLNSLSTTGEAAAAQTGAQGTQAAANQGNYLNAAGIDSAQGVQGVGNAFANAGNNYLALQAYQNRTAGLGGYNNGNTPNAPSIIT